MLFYMNGYFKTVTKCNRYLLGLLQCFAQLFFLPILVFSQGGDRIKVNMLIPKIWGDVSLLMSCVLPRITHPSPALLLQVTSPMSWWGTSWLRAALKEWSWRVVPTSLILVSGSLLPSHVHWQSSVEKLNTSAPVCVPGYVSVKDLRSFPSSITCNPTVIIVLTEVI